MMEAKVDNITNDLKALSKDAKELAHEAKNHACLLYTSDAADE